MPDASDLSFDPTQMQGLLSQYQPTEQDKHDALTRSLAAMGFGILGARGVNGWQAIGQGGQMGLLNYNQSLQDVQKQRMQSLQAAALAQKTAKEAQFEQMAMGLLNGSSGQPTSAPDGSATPSPDTAPGAPAQLPPGASSAVLPAQVPTPPMQRAPNPISNGPAYANSRVELAMALTGHKDVADVIHRQMEITQGRGGTLMRNGQLIGQVLPQGTVIFKDGDPSQPQFFQSPQEALNVAAQQAGNVAGATKRAETYSTVGQRTNPDGSVSTGYVPNLYGAPPTPNTQPAPAAPNQGQTPAGLDIASYVPQNEQEASAVAQVLDKMKRQVSLIPDAQGHYTLGPGHGLPMGQGAPAISAAPSQFPSDSATGPNPVKQAGAKSEAEGVGKVMANQIEKIDSDADSAQVMRSRVSEMRPMLDTFTPNMAAPARQKAAEMLQAMGADNDTVSKVAGGSLPAMQAFSKQSIQMAFDATRQLTSRPAAAEVILQMKANPNIGMTKPAQQAIIDYVDGIAQWKLDKQSFRDDYINANGTWKGGEAMFNKAHPVEQYLPSPDTLKATLAPATPTVAPNVTETALARQAIARGAPRDAVIQRMQQRGFDTSGL